jgi:hypothetical protein
VASLTQGRTAAAQCGLFTHKSVPVIFEPPCRFTLFLLLWVKWDIISIFYTALFYIWIFQICGKCNHFSNTSTIRCNIFTSLLLDVYVWLNMFRGSPYPSSGAYNSTRSLWFNSWTAAAGALLVVVCQTMTNNAPAASLHRLNQRLLVQLYAPDDGRVDARNMLSHA